MTFGRRVGIAAVVLLAAYAAINTGRILTAVVLAYKLAPGWESAAQLALGFIISVAVLFGVMLVLLQTQRSIAAGKVHWLASMPETKLITTLIVLLIVSRIAPHITWDSSLFESADAAVRPVPRLVLLGLSYAIAVASCYMWIWWCNNPPRIERLVLVSALAWAGFDLLMNMLDMIAPTLNVLVSRTHEESGLSIHLPGSDAFMTSHASAWIWRTNPEYVWSSLASWGLHVVTVIPVAAAIATVLYLLLNREPSVQAP